MTGKKNMSKTNEQQKTLTNEQQKTLFFTQKSFSVAGGLKLPRPATYMSPLPLGQVTSSVSCRIQIIIKFYIFNYSKKLLPQRFELPRPALLGRAPTTQSSNFFSQLGERGLTTRPSDLFIQLQCTNKKNIIE